MAAIEAIETIYLEYGTASVTFDSLGSYENLQIRMSTRCNNSTTNCYDSIRVRFATGGGSIDTGNNYVNVQMYGYQSSNGAQLTHTQNSIYVAGMSDTDSCHRKDHGPTVLDFFDYRNSSKKTTLQASFSTGAQNRSTAYRIHAGGFWNNTGNIDKIQLTHYSASNFERGSSFTLYGWRSS